MEPEEIAGQLPGDKPPLPEMDVCQKCGNKYANEGKCLWFLCEDYDEQYKDTMALIMFKNGVNDHDDLVLWIDVFAPPRETAKYNISDMAAWFLAWQSMEQAQTPEDELINAYYLGTTRLKGNIKEINSDIKWLNEDIDILKTLRTFTDDGMWSSFPSHLS